LGYIDAIFSDANRAFAIGFSIEWDQQFPAAQPDSESFFLSRIID
jgi:hypothetical protein